MAVPAGGGSGNGTGALLSDRAYQCTVLTSVPRPPYRARPDPAWWSTPKTQRRPSPLQPHGAGQADVPPAVVDVRRRRGQPWTGARSRNEAQYVTVGSPHLDNWGGRARTRDPTKPVPNHECSVTESGGQRAQQVLRGLGDDGAGEEDGG